jgi:hypothetical protein
VFTARYGLNPYIKRKRLVFKGLNLAGLQNNMFYFNFRAKFAICRWQMEISRLGGASRFRKRNESHDNNRC